MTDPSVKLLVIENVHSQRNTLPTLNKIYCQLLTKSIANSQQDILPTLNEIYCQLSTKYITNSQQPILNNQFSLPISRHKYGLPNSNHSPHQWSFNADIIPIISHCIRIKGVKCSRGKRFKLNCIFNSTIEYQQMLHPPLFAEHHSWFWRPPTIILVHFDAALVFNLLRTLQHC